ncbi:MAG TPA: hypothetical protein VES73_06100 [Lamprocystis sp. (in: g-proteobacteria)]|nr:hypothetical protein [Lamprocystis sp. (in: g-proteobacteria)]
MPKPPRLSTACAILIAAALVPGCSDNPREDVRLTLCKDMVTLALGAVPSWQGSEVRIRGYQGATVTVRLATADGNQQASCDYEYDAVDDTALTLANPIEAYSTSPSKMVLNGRTIANPELAQLVKRAMQKQGREFIERAGKALGSQ